MPAPPTLSALFIERVQSVAKERGLSVNRLADFAGLGRGFLSELLRGKKTPTLTTVEKLAAALEVSPCELLCPAAPEDG